MEMMKNILIALYDKEYAFGFIRGMDNSNEVLVIEYEFTGTDGILNKK